MNDSREEPENAREWVEEQGWQHRSRGRITIAQEPLDRDVDLQTALNNYAKKSTHPERIKAYARQGLEDVLLEYPPLESIDSQDVGELIERTLGSATSFLGFGNITKHLLMLGDEFFVYDDDPGCYRCAEFVVQNSTERWIVEIYVWE